MAAVASFRDTSVASLCLLHSLGFLQWTEERAYFGGLNAESTRAEQERISDPRLRALAPKTSAARVSLQLF